MSEVKDTPSTSPPKKDQEKVFNDPIHGHIELHPLMVKIIDTPQFQRLRYIKQLGGAYYVFPGASHNRFEHSIGVGYLAGEFVETLQKKQPELNITDEDVLCTKMAGLCHDLGHGPFSHMFDGRFIPKTRPDTKWKHEEASVKMFNHLLDENKLRPVFKRFNLNDDDITFIEEQIVGPCSKTDSTSWLYKGRKEEKSFLYEIVANKTTGIDVDKWDYFARDCHCLGIPNNFDIKRYMKFARVLNVNNRRQICTRDKEALNLYEMFHTRSSLHRRAYQHKTTKVIELMVSEALAEANDHLKIPGKDGHLVKMSEAIYDMHAYTRLTDHVVHQILVSTEPELEESRKILQKVERRELYKCIGQTQPPNTETVDKDQTSVLNEEIIRFLEDGVLGNLPTLTGDDIVVDVATFDYGMKDENPIDHMRFYTKDSPEIPKPLKKDQLSQMLPQKFREQHIRVYCKKLDQPSLQAAWKYYLNWCQRKGYTVADQDGGESGQTPYGTPFNTPDSKRQENSEESHTPTNKGACQNLASRLASATNEPN